MNKICTDAHPKVCIRALVRKGNWHLYEVNTTFQSFINHLQYEKRFSPHTVMAYQNDLLQFEQFLSGMQVTNVLETTHLDIRNWMVSLMQDGISPRSINRKISVLKSFVKFCLRQGLMHKNPMLKVQTPKVSKRLPVFVEKSGTERLLHNILFPEGYEGVLHRTIIELLYGTGMRKSELIQLKVTDIDSYQSQIRVLGKGQKERVIPVHPELLNSLKKYIEQRSTLENVDGVTTLFVTLKGQPLSPRGVYSIIKRYLDLVTTIDKRSPHVLRHTFATHLMNNGADINAVKELLGHSSLAATQVYTHNTIDKLKNIHKQAHPRG